MLQHLSITNYAIIDKLQLDLNSGFSVITGETGAGKSILLGALSLILGNRADTSVLNDKSKKCIVEGEVSLSQKFDSFFSLHDLDYDENTIIRREISSNGKSRAFINDTPVSLTVLKNLAVQLIDIHSQSQSLLLKSSNFQIDVLDAFSDNEPNLSSYKVLYTKYKAKKTELEELKSLASNSSIDNDYLTFQLKEIEALNLKSNEKEDIEEQLNLVSNAEEIKLTLDLSMHSLIDSDDNIIKTLKEIKDRFSKIESYSNEYKEIHERLNSLIIELQDVSYTINSINSEFEFDQDNIAFLNQRLSKIYAIEQKHNLNSTQEILNYQDQLKLKIQETGNFKDRIEVLESELDKIKKELINQAKKVSEVRQGVIKKIEKQIIDKLKLLGMPQASFNVVIETLETPNEKGIDKIDFLFSANKGVAPSIISKVASGGELSRLMLVIKMFLVKGKSLSSIIFDEIDTGVSGDIAGKMADMMVDISKSTQVISITHLPQVAAKGDFHYKIIKENTGENTYSNVQMLTKQDRVMELAKMLSSDNISKAAIENANVLLESN